MKYKNQYRGGKGIKSFQDIINTKVGKLTIIEFSYSEPNLRGIGNHHYYICQCDCGNQCIIKRKSLLKKEINSCGCIRKETSSLMCKSRKHQFGEEGLLYALYNTHKSQAKYRDLEYIISRELHKELVLDNCHYCGRPPSNTYTKRHIENEFLMYNGMDRKEGDLGYTKDNLVTCCLKCNKAKNTMNYKEFKEYIQELIRFNV